MRFLSIYTYDPAAPSHAHGPSEEDMMRMGALIDEMRAAGVLVDTGGVVPNGASTRVRRSGKQITVTDGPFAETKEVIGGFAMLECASRDEALKWMHRFLECAGDGTSEFIEVSTVP